MKKILSTLLILAIATVANAFTPIDLGDGKYLEVFYEGQFVGSYRNTGSGPNKTADTTSMNFGRNRLGFLGTYDYWLSFYVQTAYEEQKIVNTINVDLSNSDREFYLLDAQIRLTPSKYFNAYIGKMKNSLTRENLEASFTQLSIDKSPFIYTPYKASRDIGIALWGAFFDEKLQYRFDVTDGHSTNTAEDHTPSSNFRYTGRIQLTLLDPENTHNLAGTYIGSQEVFTLGAAYQYEPKALYADDENLSDVKDYKAYSFDAFFEYPTWAGLFTISSAYMAVSMMDAYEGADPSLEAVGLAGQRNGYYIKGGYMPPFMFNDGRFQLYGRWDSFEYANLRNEVTGKNFENQVVQRYAVGLNFYMLSGDMKLTGEFAHVEFEEEDVDDPNYRDFNSFDLCLQVRF